MIYKPSTCPETNRNEVKKVEKPKIVPFQQCNHSIGNHRNLLEYLLICVNQFIHD